MMVGTRTVGHASSTWSSRLGMNVSSPASQGGFYLSQCADWICVELSRHVQEWAATIPHSVLCVAPRGT